MDIHVGVIGTGYMGVNHARAYMQLDEVRIAAVADVDRTRGKKIARRYGARYYESYVEMLEKERLDAVSVCTPTSLHAEVGRAVIDREIPCLIEKPIASTLANAHAVARAADRSGSLVLVGHIERFNPVVRKAKELIKSDWLKDIFLINTERVSPMSTRIADVGVITDLAVHDIDVMRFVLGQEAKKVLTIAGRVYTKNVEDFAETVLLFEKGVVAHLRVNWLTPTKIRKFRVQGKFGMLDGDYINQELFYYENRSTESELIEFQTALLGIAECEMRRILVKKEEPLLAELRHFIRCVAGKEKPQVTIQDGIRALEVVNAMLRSAASGKVVSVRREVFE